MKNLIFFCSIVLISNTIAADLGLVQLKELVLKSNYELKALESDIEVSSAEIELQRSKFFPTLGIRLGREKTKTDSISDSDNINSIYGKVNLFNGFKDSKEFKKRKLSKDFLKNGLSWKTFNLTLEVEKLYYNYLYLSKQKVIIQSSIDRNKQHLKLVKKRLNSSLVTKTDLLEFNLRKSDLIVEFESTQLDLKRLKKNIFYTSGINNIDNYQLIGDLPHLNIQSNLPELLDLAIKNNPRAKRLEVTAKILNIEKKINNGDWLPKIDIKASHGYLDENDTGIPNSERSTVISAMATWEFFSGFSTTSQNSKNSAKRVALDYRLRQNKINLRLGVESIFDKIKILEKRIDSIEKNQRISLDLYKRTLREYKKGVKDSGALVSASDMFKSLSNKIYELKINYMNFKIDLERLVGTSLNFKEIKH